MESGPLVSESCSADISEAAGGVGGNFIDTFVLVSVHVSVTAPGSQCDETNECHQNLIFDADVGNCDICISRVI